MEIIKNIHLTQMTEIEEEREQRSNRQKANIKMIALNLTISRMILNISGLKAEVVRLDTTVRYLPKQNITKNKAL